MNLNVGRWVSWWAAVAPGRDAIVSPSGTLTYGEFNREVNRLANGLRARGVGPGDRIAALLSNRPEFLVVVFAASKLGAIFVPLNVRLVAKELDYIIGDSKPKVLVTEALFIDRIAALESGLAGVETCVSIDGGDVGTPWADIVGPAPADEPGYEGSWDDDLFICYTSGTTGFPKGAVLTNGNIFWSSTQEIVPFGLGGDDRHLVAVPLCFTGGLVTASLPIFHSGATMHLEPDFSPVRAMELIDRHRITTMMAVPTMFSVMQQLPEFATADLTSLRLVIVGAAPVPPALVGIYHERGVAGFTNAYGLTEGGGFNLFLPAADAATKPGAYRPALYTDARVVDASGDPAPPGEPGELLLRGPSIMRGYWGNAEATNEALAGGWLHTGDLVHTDEAGDFYPIDRVKDMIITGGLNVYPAEVEHVLFSHPKVQEVAVLGLPDARWGETVTAVVVPRPGDEITLDDLAGYCADRLADYKRPKGLRVVDEIPRNAGGKVLKRELRERFVVG